MQSQSLYGISLNFWKWLKPDSTEQAFQIHLWLLSKHVDVKDEYPPRKCNYAIICHSTLNQVKEAQLHQPLKASCWIQQGKAMSSLPANHKLWSIPLFKRKKVKWTFQKSVMHVLALKLAFLYRVRVKIASFPSAQKSHTMGRKLLLCVHCSHVDVTWCHFSTVSSSILFVHDHIYSCVHRKRVPPSVVHMHVLMAKYFSCTWASSNASTRELN